MTKQNSEIQKRIADAIERARPDLDRTSSDDEINEEFSNHEGPLLGPRDDIEKRKLINDIEKALK